MSKIWQRLFRRFCNWVYFAHISVVYPERLPSGRSVLFIGLHRNGAVDGFVYDSVLGHPIFLISAQLRKRILGRLFFSGIEVVRPKDEGDRSLNAAAMERCLGHLRAGGQLMIFPEGTSSLGPRHLPFKSGAAQLTLDCLNAGTMIQILPIGIHYERPWAFRSKVEVVIGEPISTEFGAALSALGRWKELKRRMQQGLEQIGINVVSEEYQQTIQRLACVATLGTNRSYFKTLKALERSIPETILLAWQKLEPDLRTRKLLLHQGVPLFPTGPRTLYALALAFFGPVVLGGIVANLLPFVAAWWAGTKFPDARNVVSLWRILVGVPVLIVWSSTLVLIALALGKPGWLAGYFVITGLALKLYYRVKKLTVALHNQWRYPELKPRVLAFRETVLHSLPNETA